MTLAKLWPKNYDGININILKSESTTELTCWAVVVAKHA